MPVGWLESMILNFLDHRTVPGSSLVEWSYHGVGYVHQLTHTTQSETLLENVPFYEINKNENGITCSRLVDYNTQFMKLSYF